MVRRTYKPTNTSAALARNGSRHPNAKNCASVSHRESNRNTPPERKNPSGAPNCGNMPYQARFPGGAFSIASSTAPPHSPPSPIPCPNRHSASSSGAATPIDRYTGSAPIATVDKPIVESAITSVVFRPTRSPKCPNSADPIGRAKNAIPNVASDASVPAPASVAGKNSRGNTSTAAVA